MDHGGSGGCLLWMMGTENLPNQVGRNGLRLQLRTLRSRVKMSISAPCALPDATDARCSSDCSDRPMLPDVKIELE